MRRLWARDGIELHHLAADDGGIAMSAIAFALRKHPTSITAMYGRVAILGALLLTIAGTSPACERSGEPENSSSSVGSSVVDATAPPVQEYLRVADAVGADSTVFDEKFLADALRKLAGALGTLGLADLDLQVALRVTAEHVLMSPQSLETTSAVRNSLVSAADALAAGAESNAGLRQSAESLQPDRPLADQVGTIREFLRTSGPAIRRAARR